MGKTDQEAQMIEAHKAGRAYAAKVFAVACKAAMDRKGDEEEQFAFLAGLFGELRRIATQKQNDKYNEMLRQHFKDTTIGVENGHTIRVVNTRFGPLYHVDDINRAH